MTSIYTGVIEDPRPKEEKKLDWKASELLAGSPTPVWKEKKRWKSYTERNQLSTYTCVTQAVSKLLEINEKRESGTDIVFSASKPYSKRSNVGEGSFLHEMLKYAVEGYYTLESRIPSQMLKSDLEVEQMAKKWNSVDDKIARKYGAKVYLLVSLNIDEIAYWVQQGYGVAILMFFEADEWRPTNPVIKNKNLSRDNSIRHCVSVVDAGLKKGIKTLKIEDSAHFGGKSVKWIGEEWISKRCFGAGMIYDKKNEEMPELPTFNFKTNLFYGIRDNEDVAKLQDRLKLEGFFPKEIPSTGNYLEITRQGVEKYQRFYKVGSEYELNLIKGKVVGLKTRRQLNS